MKVTRNYEDGIRTEEIEMSRLGKFLLDVVWDLLKIVVAVALALWVIWIVVPALRGLFLLYAPQACGVLYALLRRG
jgi:hypothetical protein